MTVTISRLRPRMRAIVALMAATSFGALSACSGDKLDGVVCADVAFFGVNVTLANSSAFARLGKNISGTLTQGTYSENMQLFADPAGQRLTALSGATERAGVYTLRINVTGFQEYRKDGVTVGRTKDGCHVVPVNLNVELAPQ